jgi:hypothetical protein
MAVPTTVDIPEPMYERLRVRTEQAGSSVQALIVLAIEQSYGERQHGAYVTRPLVNSKAVLGLLFPIDENPHDFVFS